MIQRVRAWLKAEGLHVFSDNEIVSVPPGIHFPAYELHISKVRELVSIEGVRELFLANCSGEAGPSVSPSKGTGTTVSQGKAAHNATAWQQAGYTGDGVIVSVS